MSWLQEIAPSVFGKKVKSKIPAISRVIISNSSVL